MPRMGRQPARASKAGATEAAGVPLRPSERALAPARRRAGAGTDRAAWGPQAPQTQTCPEKAALAGLSLACRSLI
eukprot:scaffold131695_cov69-Phaeocystis_antarctica.AAC.5